MKKFILIPDSFKGTLSSVQICDIMKEKIDIHFPQSDVMCIPVADGGEGSVDAFITAIGGEKVYETVKNPYFEDMKSYYGLIDGGQTAVVEMASCSGLPLVEDRKNPKLTTTYGAGELILAAAKSGVKKIIVGLGGSSTNDGGCGAAAAVGVKFYDKDGKAFVPTGGTLIDIAKIDLAGKDEALKKVEIVTMCDIDNPMFGKTGASYIFGPQKGADPQMIEELDQGIKNLSKVIADTTGKDISEIPGTGAAGAMGAGMIAFFDSRLQMGIQTVLDTVRLDDIISDADYILTGEGKLDSQSLRGKVVIGIAGRAKKQNKNVIAIVGGADDAEIDEAYEMGVTAVFPINRLPQDFSISKNYSKENLSYTVDNILRLIKTK
ncbi:glycerate kinase family protein [Anaerocolumna sp. MB42-C2]|uniref:glycerate kinase family protein n=1 Tax=Anaerocolumna sp. MB42-C2 TaxID=3070997 RepID=UPI0027E094F1|nr:glycerate kinase [Anaerocolumna sp. MB42-C2]WMJ89471.1 glycerate kinase [Anaerocolumna sp. MB42-C2]